MFTHRKTLAILFTALLFLFSFTRVDAQSEALLQQIANNTNDIKNSNNTIRQTTTTIKDTTATILERLNTLPKVLEDLGTFIKAWMDEDDSDVTTNMVPNFTEMKEIFKNNYDNSPTIQAQLNRDLLGDVNKQSMPYANDLVYSTLLGKPFFGDTDPRGKDVVPQYNYIKNAAGITIPHTIPAGSGWGGSKEEQARYVAYFNAAKAAESFSGYILSNQYLEGNKFNVTQQKLIDQANDPEKWFAEVASENIGFVLRQLLIYQSQIFVLLTQSIQLQKQMATAQAMTNALMITTNLPNEALLLSKAQAVRAT